MKTEAEILSGIKTAAWKRDSDDMSAFVQKLITSAARIEGADFTDKFSGVYGPDNAELSVGQAAQSIAAMLIVYRKDAVYLAALKMLVTRLLP